MTTTIVYPDAGSGGTTVDGHVRRGGVTLSFTDIRTTSGNSHTDTAANENCAQLTATTTSNQYSVLRRSIYTFDTSAVPATDVISAVTFSLYGSAKTNGLGEPDLDVVTATPASNNDLVNGDYLYTNFGTSPFGSVPYASFSTSGYNDISLSTGAVTPEGITKLGVRLSWDTDNSAPTWSSGAVTYFEGYYADQSGTTNDPKLTVVHAAPTADSRIFIIS